MFVNQLDPSTLSVIHDRASAGNRLLNTLFQARSRNDNRDDFFKFDITGRTSGRVDLEAVTGDWLRYAHGGLEGRLSVALRRGFDLLASIILLLLLLLPMIILAALVRLDSPGPAIFRQLRSGLHGKPFIMFKFRSMSIDAEADGKPIWAQQEDPRITRVGRLIRLTRIDELPQLVNVLRGEMSLIGPRPERPHFVEQLAREIPFYRERAVIKPGITGWAQVNLAYSASIEDTKEKLAYDLYYLKHRNWLLDVRILVASLRVVLFREGAR